MRRGARSFLKHLYEVELADRRDHRKVIQVQRLFVMLLHESDDPFDRNLVRLDGIGAVSRLSHTRGMKPGSELNPKVLKNTDERG